MSDVADQLRRAADLTEALQAEATLRRDRELEVLRKTYRRGYFAGHAAGRNGRPCESAPERRCRKELVEL